MRKLVRSPFFQIVIAQLLTTVALSLMLVFVDKRAVYSTLVAGVVCILPGIYLLFQSVKPVGLDSGLKQVLKGEAGRIALTIALFVIVFLQFPELNVLVFFGTIALLQVLHGLVPVWAAMKLMKHPGLQKETVQKKLDG